MAVCKKLQLLEKFLRLKKTTPYSKIFTVPNVFIVTPIDVLCSNFVTVGLRQIVRCLPDKQENFAWLVFDAFSESEPVDRAYDGSDMT